MLNDLRYAYRSLRHRPGLALTAILSIALGIGANASIFSLVDGLLLRPLPVPDPSGVVTLRSRTPAEPLGTGLLSWPDYLDFRNWNHSFRGLVAYEYFTAGFARDARGEPEVKVGMLVSSNFFRVLETEPRLGRGFLPEEDRVPGRDAAAVLSHDFWNNQLHADPSIVGRHVRLNGLDFTVIGVAPESFTEMDQFVRPAFFVPAAMGPKLSVANANLLTDRNDRVFWVKGRLKQGISVNGAGAEAAAIAASLERAHPATNRDIGVIVRTEMRSRLELSPGAAIISALLFGVVALLLTIACANVANLLLSRGRSRAREIAVRLAIGASRFRLVRQLMTESLLIALAGGALGLLMAATFLEASSGVQIPGDIPIELTFQLNARVLWFAVAVSAASAVLFGLAPAVQSVRPDLVPALKSGEADQARKRVFGRGALVAIQVAGSLVLLMVTMQLLRGISYELSQDPGFRRDHVLVMTFDPSLARYTPAQTEQFYRTVVERARSLPGVKSAALASTIPLSTNFEMNTVVPEGYQFPRGQENVKVWTSAIDEHFFDTLSVRIVRGRGILASDRANTEPVAVVSEAFARRYFNGKAVGKRLRVNGSWREIVGVTAPGRYFTGTGLEQPSEALFLPFHQRALAKMTLLAETSGDAAGLAAPLRALVRQIDPNLPSFGVRTLRDYFEQRSVKMLDLVTGMIGVFGLIGAALALVGLYAVVAWQVAGRTREIGIRMAVGAGKTRVVRLILRQAVGMSVSGLGLGLVLSIAAARALSVMLPPLPPFLFAAVPGALLLTTMAAAAIPARRAARVDPIQALRQE